MENAFDPLFDPAYSAQLGGWSFLLGIIGTILTLFGLYLTYRQARTARRAAIAAGDAVREFRFRSDRYDAFRDLSQASYALDMTRRHLNNDAWRDAAESYEDARRAIIRVQTSTTDLSDGESRRLSKICSHLTSFCDKVDAALAGKVEYPDQAKVMNAIRRHHETLAALQRSLQEGVN